MTGSIDNTVPPLASPSPPHGWAFEVEASLGRRCREQQCENNANKK
jgi:hypothetical protein